MQKTSSYKSFRAKVQNKLLRKTRKRRGDELIPAVHPLVRLQQTIGNQAVGRLIQAQLKVEQPGDKFEQQADQMAEVVMRMSESQMKPREEKDENLNRQPVKEEKEIREQPIEENEEKLQQQPEEENEEVSIATKQVPGHSPIVTTKLQAKINTLRGNGKPLSRSERSFFESRFHQDFSQVRIHNDSQASETARAITARAITVGRDIVFGAGEYEPHSAGGRQLLAHELTHTLQQKQGKVRIQRESLEEAIEKDKELKKIKNELDDELQKWAKGKGISETLDPNHPEYAFTLQEYAFKLTVGEELKPLPRPSKKTKQAAAWSKNHKKAYLLSMMILESGKEVTQKEARAAMIAQYSLAKTGLVKEAMKLAESVTDKEEKEAIYTSLVDQAHKLNSSQLKVITQFFISSGRGLENNPIIEKSRDETNSFCKKLGNEKLKAVLDIIIDSYKKEPGLIKISARILIYFPKFREDFSRWMWEKDKEFLSKILESEYFVEPDYGGVAFEEKKAVTMAKDMPWVYKWKQKYYVEYLSQVGEKAGVKIPTPKTMNFPDIKNWLDTNTERIGEALNKLYSKQPKKITDTYEKIADAFFYHVDRGNVIPNLMGRLSHLKAGAPKGMRIKSDCDVLAT